MNLHEIEKRCRFYRRTKMVEREKQLLKAVLLNPDKNPDWAWGIQRMLELDPNFNPLKNDEFSFEIKPDVTPKTREEIAKLSFQYQGEWRFEREKRLIQYALKLFPDWKYLHNRMEWHSRPIFHHDPEKSKTQIRKPLRLPRDPQYIPKQESIDSMCFVTGASYVYFDLVVQLIESIKNTQYYNTVQINVIDGGLTNDQRVFLKKKFNVNIKNPGWDINPEKIVQHPWKKIDPLSAVKVLASRPYLDTHFPGYKYYFVLDSDTWLQDERFIDQMLSICEADEISIPIHSGIRKWDENHVFYKSLPDQCRNDPKIYNHLYTLSSAFCITQKMLEKYRKLQIYFLSLMEDNYLWGMDEAILNYLYHYTDKKNSVLDADHFIAETHHSKKQNLVSKDNIIYCNDSIVKIINCSALRGEPHRLLFSNQFLYDISKKNASFDIQTSEEYAYTLCKDNAWTQDILYFRTYPKPEDMYGNFNQII